MAAASSLPRRALLSLAGLATLSALFSTGCPPSPAPARCSAVLQNTLTGDRQAVALGDNAFPRAFWVCGENPSRSQVEAAWSGYLEARLAELCAPGGPPFLERAIFCQGGSWCRVPTTTVCEVNQPNSDTARCTPPPTMAGLAECSGPPPGTPRLCVEPAAGVSFGHVPVNTLGTQTLRLTNCGGAGRVVVAPPTARDITPMMDPPGDSFVGTGLEPSWDCALTPAEMDPMVGGAILGPGARSQCEITLRFRPGTQGAKTASLALSYHLGDRNNQLQRVPLEGIGDVGKLLFAGNALPCSSPVRLCFDPAHAVPTGTGCWRRTVSLAARSLPVRLRGANPALPLAGYRDISGLTAGTPTLNPGAPADWVIENCGALTQVSFSLRTNDECNNYPITLDPAPSCSAMGGF